MAKKLGKLKVLVPAPHVPAGYSPVLMAQSLGYASEEGLDLSVIPIGRPKNSIAGAVAGEGVGFVNTVFNFLIRDQDKPFRSFYSIARKQNRSFAVPQNSDIACLADLKGKVIGLHYPDLLEFAYAALSAEGVDPQKDVKFIDLPGTPLDEKKMVHSARTGEVHAIWQIDHNYGLFASEGLPLRQLPAPAIDRLTPSAFLYANDELLKKQPELYAILGRSVAKATVFANANPEAVIRLLWRDVPEARPAAGDEERTLRRDIAILKDRLALCEIHDATDPRWGAITTEEMTRWRDFMLETKAIETRRDPSEYFTSELVDQFNTFDADEIIRQAKNYPIDTIGKKA